MKNFVNHLTRITLLAAIVVGLVAGSGAVPAFAKKKSAASTTPASTDSNSMTDGDKGKPEAKHHKKHRKGKKGEAAASSEATSPKQ